MLTAEALERVLNPLTRKLQTVPNKMTAFEPHTSLHGTDIIYVDNLFTEDEREDIIEYHHTWERKEGRTTEKDPETKETDGVKSDYRICTLYHPPCNDELEQFNWLNTKLLKIITKVNQDYYKFNIEAFAEPPNLMRYDAENSGHYDYHLDIGAAKPNCWRKLSYSLILNDAYEGGKLEFKTGRGIVEYSPTVGRMILFPSYLLHKVNPVTSGVRWVLVGWAHGASFQ